MVFNEKELKIKGRKFNLEPFSMTPLGLLQNEDYLRDNRSKIILFNFLCSRIVRNEMRKDPLDIYKRYYKEGILACSITIDVLKEKFGYKDDRIIRSWIKDLKKERYLDIVKVKLANKQEQNVYLLGTHGSNGEYLMVYDKYNVGKPKGIKVVNIPAKKAGIIAAK